MALALIVRCYVSATDVALKRDAKLPVLTPASYAKVTAVLVPGLRTVRLERALTQEELAERAKVGRKTIIRGEGGLDIRISSVRRLADALRVNPARLMQPPRH